MRLRTFTAPDMNRAMLMIREALGDSAVILSSVRDKSGQSVSITAAVEEVEEGIAQPPHTTQSGGITQYLAAKSAKEHAQQQEKSASLAVREALYLLNELERILQFHGAPQGAIDDILAVATRLDANKFQTEEGVCRALAESLSGCFDSQPISANAQTKRFIFVGLPGAGKTLTVARLAAQLTRARKPVRVLSIDTRRAGGITQLQAFTRIMGFDTEVANSRTELRQLLKLADANIPVLVDAFSTNPYSFEELKDLNDFAGLHGLEPVLVVAAGCDAAETADTAQAFSFMGIKRVVVTRVDAAKRYGAALAAAHAAGLAFADMSMSANLAVPLEPITPQSLAEALCAHREEGEVA